ncbi:MAG: glycosyltransferase [Bacteroidales bacterium]|nr:glycosyltransferase [Bacteroidales bacterium]
MRVGLFIDTYFPYVDGVVKVVDNYARRLSRMCEVTVFTVGCYKGYDENLDKEYPYKIVRTHVAGFKNSEYIAPFPFLDPVFQKKLWSSKLDIIHIHSPFSIAKEGLKYAKVRGIPAVSTLHSQYKKDVYERIHFPPFRWISFNFLMSTFNASHLCWAVNDAVKNLYINEYGLKTLCLVKNNATDHIPVEDPIMARKLVNETFRLKSDRPLLIFVGRLARVKNEEFLVRSLKILKEKGQKFQMLFVGGGPNEKHLAQMVAELSMGDCIKVAGPLDNLGLIRYIYSAADLMLFPSLYDCSSIVQIEAACQRTPVLFVEGAATASTVTPEVNGFVAPNDETAYADAVMGILKDPERLQRVSEGALRDLYVTWDTAVAGVYEDYKSIIESYKKK